VIGRAQILMTAESLKQSFPPIQHICQRSRTLRRFIPDEGSYSPDLGDLAQSVDFGFQDFMHTCGVLLQVVWFTLCCVINKRLNSLFMRTSAIFTAPRLCIFCSIYLHHCTLTVPVFAAFDPSFGTRICKSPASSFAVNFSMSTSSGKVK
jgi:hypothetical protein